MKAVNFKVVKELHKVVAYRMQFYNKMLKAKNDKISKS